MFRYIAALVSVKRKKYTIEAVSELTFILFYLIIRFGWSSFSVGRVETVQYKNRLQTTLWKYYNQNHNLLIKAPTYFAKNRLTIIIFYLELPSNPGGSAVSAVLPTTQTFIKIIWLWLSWKCKLATVTSYKADVSSVSPSSERRAKRQLFNSLRWPIYILNLVDIAKLPCCPHRRSTTVSLETFTLYL